MEEEEVDVPDYEPPSYEEVVGIASDGRIAYTNSHPHNCVQCRTCNSHVNLACSSDSLAETENTPSQSTDSNSTRTLDASSQSAESDVTRTLNTLSQSTDSDATRTFNVLSQNADSNATRTSNERQSDNAIDVITEEPVDEGQPYEGTRVDENYVRIDDRLIFDFEKITCTRRQRSGLEVGVKVHIPIELTERGITSLEWYQWMYELEQIQNTGPTECGCVMLHCFPGCILQYVVCMLCCPLSRPHCCSSLPCCYGDYFEALRNWTAQVNDKLQGHDMYAKLLTYKPFVEAPKSKRYESRVQGRESSCYEMSFLVIALTPDECVILEAEPWNHGFQDCLPSRTGRSL